MITTCIISFIIVASIIGCAILLMNHQKYEKPRNKVHFYIARDKEGDLTMWLGKPHRYRGYWVNTYNNVLIASSDNKLNSYGIDIEKYDNLKLEDEPVEVFLNLNN